jgi:hypothetical protein
MRIKPTFVATFLTGFFLLYSPAVSAAEPRVLVYQRNGKGFVHDNLAASAAAIRELGEENGFAVEVSTNSAVFTDENLTNYQALIFANSNNEAFVSKAQRGAFQRYIRGGGGFMGIHSSTGSERHWPYFQKVQGAKSSVIHRCRNSPSSSWIEIILPPRTFRTRGCGPTSVISSRT